MTAKRDALSMDIDNRRSMDQLEVAAELQDKLNERGIEAVRAVLNSKPHPDFDGVHCMDCSEEIDPRRLELLPHSDHCTDCQERKEKRR